MKRIFFLIVLNLVIATSLSAQEQKVKRSDIIENLKGQPYYMHFVGNGETLQAIADAYGISPIEIIKSNPEIADGLKVNQVIKIPAKSSVSVAEKQAEPQATVDNNNAPKPREASGKTHTIEPKETWYGISRLYQVPVKDLISANPGIDTLKIGMQISIPEVATGNQQPVTNANIQHTVQAQETLYGISKKYNVSIDDLYKNNPGLSEGLKTGQVLNITEKKEETPVEVEKPVVKEPTTTTQQKPQIVDSQPYKEHTVARKETLYSIAKKYGVEVSDILNANPGLTGEIKKNQVLRIPVPKTAPVEVKPVVIPDDVVKAEPEKEQASMIECSPGRNKNQQYKVALLIPFMLEETDSIVTMDPTSLKLPDDYKSFDFIQFYEGALLAIDSLSRAGMNLKVLVFDVDAGDHVSKTRRILSNPEMAGIDLIIGPFFVRSFELVAEFAASHSIPIINPLSQRSEILSDNPYVYKVQPSPWSQYNETARYIADTYSGANVLILRRNQEENSSMAASLKSALEKHGNGAISIKEAIYSQTYDAGLFNNMVAGKKNIVLVLTSDKALLPALMRKMNDSRGKYDITLFGLPEWENLEIDSHYLLNLNTHLYNGWFVDYSHKSVRNFVSSFTDRYKTDPELEQLAFLGYDISLFFMGNLFNYGRDFSKCLDSIDHKGLSTSFSFWKTESGGYENSAASVYELKDYKRRVVNR
ncbi:MAG: LysM peptidoglycan-binding domain-containing protein [Lentimicrobium sp.]|nr:LysM peptidoglycan-binding domain-containing protein [Lentimicrobium sp.]